MSHLKWRCAAPAAAFIAMSAQAQAPAVSVENLAQCYEQQAELLPFSGVVLARNGSTEFLRTAGLSDPARKIPIAAETRFRLASVQKVLTKTAIGLLVEQGRVDFDAPVGRYVPGLPPELGAATIEQLLQHRSGAPRMLRISPEIGAKIDTARTARELVPLVASQPMTFAPGEKQEYSNGGYFLLGAVIEHVTGKSYADYLDEALFKPLGMTATSLQADQRTALPQSNMARSMPGAAAMIPASDSRGSPAGSGVSTAADLLKLGQALAGNALLSRKTRERLFPPSGEAWRIGQSGGSLGTNTDLTVFPDNGWVLAVLSNYDPPAGEIMAETLRGVMLSKQCKPLSASDRPSPIRMRPPTS